jgi:hypothetical protein
MVEEPERRRVLVVLETHWDRKQLAACREDWAGRIEIAFPEPDDVACPFDFDAVAFVEAAARGELGRIDGVTSSSDYPGATLAAAIATRLGLPGSRPECVLGASHKYYSRLAQREAVPDAVPGFAVLDARDPSAPAPLPFPFFLKPVKGAFSVLARRIDDEAALRRFLAAPAVREFGDEYMGIFNRLVETFTSFEVDGHGFVAEELLRGDLVTLEGYVKDGRVEILGIVDSILHPGGSFARFDYPSLLPAPVRERMAEVARRAIRRLGLEATLFNIEMTWERQIDRIAIVEINPRICGQFADLYQKVDGIHTYEIALALCTGAPLPAARGGRYPMASSVPLRVFEPKRVLRAPAPADVAAAEALFPGTLVWSECSAGEALSDFDVDEDGASHRYAVVNLGGADRAEIEARLAEVAARLDYRMERLGPA